MSKKKDRIYFENLDVIRFLAAFMIVVLHGYEAWCGWFGELGVLTGNTYKEFSTGGKYIDQLLTNLGIGVDVFFLISGFLITYILLVEKKRTNTIQIGKFMIRRSLRIWPLYYGLILVAPFLVRVLDSSPPDYLSTLFFWNNFHEISSMKWTFPFGHFWSICIEEHFYLFWPFIIYLVPKKHLIKTFAALIFVSILFRLYTSLTMESPLGTLFLHTLSRMDVLVVGAIGAYFYADKPFEFKLQRHIRWSLVMILILSFMIEPVANWNSLFLAAFKKYYYIAIIAVLLLDYNFNPHFKHILKPKSIIHYFGKISYGIYMYSNILLLIIIKQVMWRFEITNAWVFFLIVFSSSIIIPILSYELFEKQILKLSNRFRVIQTER